ncbi:hypothetical protein VSS37_10280, partial [Candidatus Thiothrix sp. Deng01]
LQNDRYSQETPLSVAGLGLQNTGRQLQNDRYSQETPLSVAQQKISNYGNWQLNQKRGLELDSTRQLQPTENALSLQSDIEKMHDAALQDGVDVFRLTGNADSLNRAMAAAYGKGVRVDALPDGAVQVQGNGSVRRFGSVDEFLAAVGHQEAEAGPVGKDRYMTVDGQLFDVVGQTFVDMPAGRAKPQEPDYFTKELFKGKLSEREKLSEWMADPMMRPEQLQQVAQRAQALDAEIAAMRGDTDPLALSGAAYGDGPLAVPAPVGRAQEPGRVAAAANTMADMIPGIALGRQLAAYGEAGGQPLAQQAGAGGAPFRDGAIVKDGAGRQYRVVNGQPVPL